MNVFEIIPHVCLHKISGLQQSLPQTLSSIFKWILVLPKLTNPLFTYTMNVVVNMLGYSMSSRMALQSLHVIVANRYVFTFLSCIPQSSECTSRSRYAQCIVYRFVFFFLHFGHLLAVCCVVKKKLQEIRRYPYICRESSIFQPFNQLGLWITCLFAKFLHRSHLETRKSPSQRSEDHGQWETKTSG